MNEEYILFVWYITIKRYVFIECRTGQERFEIGPLFTAFNRPSVTHAVIFRIREKLCAQFSREFRDTQNSPEFPPKISAHFPPNYPIIKSPPHRWKSSSLTCRNKSENAFLCAELCIFAQFFAQFHNVFLWN